MIPRMSLGNLNRSQRRAYAHVAQTALVARATGGGEILQNVVVVGKTHPLAVATIDVDVRATS